MSFSPSMWGPYLRVVSPRHRHLLLSYSFSVLWGQFLIDTQGLPTKASWTVVCGGPLKMALCVLPRHPIHNLLQLEKPGT